MNSLQRLNTLWKMASAVSSVKDIAQQSKTYYFPVMRETTLYLQAENAAITVRRWNRPQIEITAHLQMPFGWRIASEQDEAGIYFVAKRRAVVGGLSGASFELLVPQDAYLVLKIAEGSLKLESVDGTFNIAPPDKDNQVVIQSGNL